ncbi:MAG: AarF/ABC1/UbiB kinase family protein [Cyanothece sp. SIO1E1]|nr:AarF/ABC1/UbiB kinase family protein [Cyanothece sp. SIO1E1]
MESEFEPAGRPLKSAQADSAPEPTMTDTTDTAVPKMLRYDPEAIAARYRPKPIRVFSRIVSILWPCVTFSFSLWLDRITNKVEPNAKQRAIHLREILTRLGPAYIKVGQALSTRPDLLPAPYLSELTKLQDQLPPFSNQLAFQFIQEELGAHPHEIYAELSSNPVSAASLGQVYKGKLKTGETVAVKVQRPDLAERITLDLYILRQLSIWATRSFKQIRSDLVGIMDEFGARIFEEMDYAHEGRNAEHFAQLYGHLPDIYVPKIYWPYTGRRVLTMEWISGVKLTQHELLQAQGINTNYLVEIGVQCSLRQLLEHGFFHADPHPGNLLATPDQKLAYLDFGMMSEVKPHQRYGLIEAVVHMVNRDFGGLANDYIKLEFLTPDTDLTPIIPALADVFNDALGASVAEMNFKSITDKFSAVMYDYPFRVPAYYALIIRSLVTLEGIAINVDPNFKVLSKAYPYVAKRLLTDPAPELRSSLQELLFRDDSFRWNRLENLLRNARDSDEYDLSYLIDQTLNFLFSERGEFIRDRIVEEIVNGVDTLGRNAVENVFATLNQITQSWSNQNQSNPEHASKKPTVPNQAQNELEPILRILKILQDTPGFDPIKLAPLVPRILLQPETHQMGQRIAGELAQKATARLIRELLLSNDSPLNNNHQSKHPPQPQPAKQIMPSGRSLPASS